VPDGYVVEAAEEGMTATKSAGKIRFTVRALPGLVVFLAVASSPAWGQGDGVFVRFKLLEPQDASYYVRFGGYIHKENWYLPAAVFPTGADKDAKKRFAAGAFTDWFDIKAWAGKNLHGRLNRSGGVAEFPNVSATFVTDKQSPSRRVLIELATAPDEKAVAKQFDETVNGNVVMFLVSPRLAQDKDSLETLGQMAERHLAWARETTGGKRVSPKNLIVQTGLWDVPTGVPPKDAEAVWLLGFNVVGGQTPEIHAKFPELLIPGSTFDVKFGPEATREQIDALMKRHAERNRQLTTPGVPFEFSDEICCRPEIGKNPKALEHFRAWLAERNITPEELGVAQLNDVAPIENPKDLKQRQKDNAAAANRIFYYTCRFRQQAGTERIKWTTESFHKYFAPGLLTTTLVADHPYFGGTGLGMGMVPNSAWGGAPLALDWFDLARAKAVDIADVEDWMGLQYMYGPDYTWEGFQLMGFQAAIFRSGSGGTIPIMACITPSDETNLRLKTGSSLAQGAKHFFYWTYGPTALSTENYWSDLRSEYDGVAKVIRQLAAAEHILAPGAIRQTRLALLYSISSDIWQPCGYIHMLERRATYLSLIQDQYLVDMLTEQDIESGRLKDCDVLYATDPCITAKAAAGIEQWVQDGGYLYGSCAAGSRNEFNDEVPGLSKVFGVQPEVRTQVQPGEYRIRGSLNPMNYLDQVRLDKSEGFSEGGEFGVLGVKVSFAPTTGVVIGKLKDGAPAVAVNTFGKGKAVYFGSCPGLAYLKDAKFVPKELKEQYPSGLRRVINGWVAARGVARLVELSEPVVEAGVYDAEKGTALTLANFTYKTIEKLTVRLPLARPVKSVRSAEDGELKFALEAASPAHRALGYPHAAVFTMKLGLNDIILLE